MNTKCEFARTAAVAEATTCEAYAGVTKFTSDEPRTANYELKAEIPVCARPSTSA